MIDVYIWIGVWVVILIMLIISLTKIENRIAEDRINKICEDLKERKKERLAMPRYIDADAIDLGRVSDSICQWQAQEAIDDTPTADVVEVVRCKDCKHSEHWYKDKRRCFLWNEAGIDVFEDGFCSYGERRDNGQTHLRKPT